MSGIQTSKSVASSSVRYETTEPARQSRLLTTADTAKVLGLSRSGVLYLAHQGTLPFEPTRGGQLVFHWGDVQRCLLRRADAQTRSRPDVLRALHLARRRTSLEPRQLSLLSHLERSLRLVRPTGGERSLCDRAVKVANLFDESPESDTRSSVDRKVAGRHR